MAAGSATGTHAVTIEDEDVYLDLKTVTRNIIAASGGDLEKLVVAEEGGQADTVVTDTPSTLTPQSSPSIYSCIDVYTCVCTT